MITPVDCPPLSAASLDLLCASFERALTRGLWAVAPENNGKHGHPLLVNREMIDAFLAAPVTSNAREVLHAHAAAHRIISVPDALVKAGLNTPRRLRGPRRENSAAATLESSRKIFPSTAASASIARWPACDDAAGSPPTARTNSSLLSFPASSTVFPRTSLRQRRSARHRRHAALRPEANLCDPPLRNFHRELQNIAAGRILDPRRRIRIGNRSRVARVLKMIENLR